MIKSIIFDLDGTLLDTLDDLTNAINYVMKEFNLELKTKEQVNSYIGNGIKKLVARCLIDEENNPLFNDVFSLFESYYSSHCDILTKPYPGILELLDKLKDDYKLAVVSNKNHYATKKLIEKYFPNTFMHVQGLCEPFNKKPSKDMLIHTMDVLNVKNHEVIYVGDSEVDIYFAFNANTTLISVDYGFRERAFLVDRGARILASSAIELYKTISSLSRKYCVNCGTKLINRDLVNEGNIPYCPNCNKFQFSMFNSAVSMIVVNKDETKGLFIEQYSSKRNILVAGYVTIGETLEETVKREVLEEVGLHVVEVRFNASSYHAKSNTLISNFIAVVEDEDIKIKEDEVDFAFWVNKEDMLDTVEPTTLAKEFVIKYLEGTK